MAKMLRRDGFLAITEAVNNNDIDTANAIFSILSQSIEKDRENNSFTESIELSKKQLNIFKGKYNKFIKE